MKWKSVIWFLIFCGLLGAGCLAAYLSFQPEPPAETAAAVAINLEREIKRAEEDIRENLIPLKEGRYTDADKTAYPFLVYEADSLIFWSDNNYVPNTLVATDSFDVRLLVTGSEASIARKMSLGDRRSVVSVIPLQREYAINNDYLSTEWNDRIFPSENFSILEESASIGIPVCVKERCYFRISFIREEFRAHEEMRYASLIFFLLSLVPFLVLVYRLAGRLRNKSPELAFFFLYSVFMLARLGMTQLDFPNVLVRSQLFDPQIFASSDLNASLGDLLINMLAILALCFYVFRHYPRFTLLNFRYNPLVAFGVDVFAALCVLFAGLFPFVVIQTLYNNSSILLDIARSLRFDALRIISVVIVLLSGACAFLFSHPFIRILVSDPKRVRMFTAAGIAIVVFVLINEFSGQFYLSSLAVTVAYFASVYFMKLYTSLKRFSYATFAYLFTAIFFLSLNGAYAIQRFSLKEKIEGQFRFATNFLIDRDYFGEYLLHGTSRKIAEDAFIQTRMASPFLGKDAIRQKIRQVFLPNYFNKYDVNISIFNALGEPIDNTDSRTFQDFLDAYNHEPFKTDYDSIYYLNSPELDITQKYLIVVPIRRLNIRVGYVIVELSLKKLIPENVYPELLVDHRSQQFYRTQDLSYAVFANDKLSFTSGNFNYEKFFDSRWMGDPALHTKGIVAAGYDHIAQEDQSGRVAIVSSEREPFMHKLANFSFLFVLGLLVILVLIVTQGVYYYFRGNRLFFSARIQLYLNLAFFIPLIIVSLSVMSLTSQSSQQQLNAEYLNKSRTFGEQIAGDLEKHLRSENESYLGDRLADLAKLSNLDANVFSTHGTLIATSQPLIFENNLLSKYINSRAFSRILEGENLLIESEQVGKLQYYVAYAALKSPLTGKLIGILGLPFFQSAYTLEKVQITVFTNVLNTFAFIFIVLLVLSYFVSGWLTFPLRFITQSLRKTSLTKTNTPLTWSAQDEIGLMVKEYNSMLHKLSESKAELERTQREKAWREIAQQVAHEIKNPLTPMKLTLQQLERAVQAGGSSPEKTHKAIGMLLAQVDTLNEIASSFSGFAKMPEPVIQKLEVVSLLKRTVDLHSPSGRIVFRAEAKEAWVLGDGQLLGRAFSNIILNGLQSGLPGKSVELQVNMHRLETCIRIVFKDNGNGIDPQIADRIFVPHFSTKKSGSGLGLAITRQAIEQMKGKIWFETVPGRGTSFFIELPVC